MRVSLITPLTFTNSTVVDQQTRSRQCVMLIREKYNSTEPKTDVNLSLNGFTQFKIKEHKLGFRSELGNLRLAILAIIDLLVKVSLSSASTLEPAIVSTLAK